MKTVELNHLQLKLQETRKNGNIFFKPRNSCFFIKQCLNSISGILEGAFVPVRKCDALGSLQAALAAGAGCRRFARSRGTAKMQPALTMLHPQVELKMNKGNGDPPLCTKLQAPLDPNTITDVYTETASLQTFRWQPHWQRPHAFGSLDAPWHLGSPCLLRHCACSLCKLCKFGAVSPQI